MARNNVKKVAQQTTGYICDANGELQSFNQTKVFNLSEEPPYIKVYFQDVCYLSNTPKRYATLLWSLITRVSYAGETNAMCVVVNKAVKKEICKQINWTNTVSVDNGLQVLMKRGLIRRVDRGLYQFNPYIFGRGSWGEVEKLRLSVDYDRDGRKFTSKDVTPDDNGEYFENEILGGDE